MQKNKDMDKLQKNPPSPSRDAEQGKTQVTRRDFLRKTGLGMAMLSLSSGCINIPLDDLFQKHFHKLTPEELKDLIARLEKKHSRKYGKAVTVDTTPALPDTIFGYGLDLSRCIGCRRCVYACVDENNQSRDPQIQWIRVLQMDNRKGVDVSHADPYYNSEEVPVDGHFYMPVQCQQCTNPPCVKSCPVKATWQEPDGIVVVDYNWCLGCRCCMAACPYGARCMNWGEPTLPAADMNPQTHYLGNRPRPRGCVEKCTFCIQRTRKGLYPACVEICPVGARIFGNILDANSDIRKIMKARDVFIFKKELETEPRFFYFQG